MPEDFIQQFIDETIQKAGFVNLSPQIIANYQESLRTLLLKKLGIEATALLSDSDLSELTGTLEKQPDTSPKAIFAFYDSHIGNFAEKMADVLREFQEEYLATVKQVTG
jgi:hypothetical protein